MVADLLASPDRDTRGLGLQQVRQGVPGAEATRRFCELLPKLEPTGQATLLEALGERGDPAARPAVLNSLASPDEMVRTSALRALASLGEVSDVSLLAQKAAVGSDLEKEAARQVLLRVQGEKFNTAMLEVMATNTPPATAELLRVLAARKATTAIPAVLRSAAASDRSVRLAAFEAAKTLAGVKEAPALVQLLAAAEDEIERQAAETALLAVCNRSGEGCAPVILEAMPGAGVPARLALVRALAVIGGPKALAAVADRLSDSAQSVCDEAVRVLSLWPDPAAAPHLLRIARETKSPAHQVQALHGLIRLSAPEEKRPANLESLGEAWKLAKRPEEKRLVLAALGGIATPASLKMTLSAMEIPELTQEAAWAALAIAEKLPPADSAEIRAAMQIVLRHATDPSLRSRAERLLEPLR